MPTKHITPVFSLKANVWRGGRSLANPPDLIVSCQLTTRVTARLVSGLPGVNQQNLFRFIYVAKGTDIRPSWVAPSGDIVEIPAGSGRTYIILDVDDVAKGLPNEFRVGSLGAVQNQPGGLPAWPLPIP